MLRNNRPPQAVCQNEARKRGMLNISYNFSIKVRMLCTANVLELIQSIYFFSAKHANDYLSTTCLGCSLQARERATQVCKFDTRMENE